MLPLIQNLDIKNKTILLRADLNVPFAHNKLEDASRITRLLPTLKYLLDANAKIIIISHFGRPKGEFKHSMSLAPIAHEISKLIGVEVKFANDTIGDIVKNASSNLNYGEILLLENLRFHKEEEANDYAFAKELASLADIYVNDAFSCSHRSHASIDAITKFLPKAAGLLLQEEVSNLERLFLAPKRPMAAIIGGSKISTKIDLLHNLIKQTDIIAIGGAMANTFLKAKGFNVGTSLIEEELVELAANIIASAKINNVELILPIDAVTAENLSSGIKCNIVDADKVPPNQMILDIGPKTVSLIIEKLSSVKTLVLNGPVGAFEIKPFDISTASLARSIATLTNSGQLISVAGGGDIVSAITGAGLINSFNYVSTAGGAFLEWLEGKELPGIKALSS